MCSLRVSNSFFVFLSPFFSFRYCLWSSGELKIYLLCSIQASGKVETVCSYLMSAWVKPNEIFAVKIIFASAWLNNVANFTRK